MKHGGRDRCWMSKTGYWQWAKALAFMAGARQYHRLPVKVTDWFQSPCSYWFWKPSLRHWLVKEVWEGYLIFFQPPSAAAAFSCWTDWKASVCDVTISESASLSFSNRFRSSREINYFSFLACWESTCVKLYLIIDTTSWVQMLTGVYTAVQVPLLHASFLINLTAAQLSHELCSSHVIPNGSFKSPNVLTCIE